ARGGRAEENTFKSSVWLVSERKEPISAQTIRGLTPKRAHLRRNISKSSGEISTKVTPIFRARSFRETLPDPPQASRARIEAGGWPDTLITRSRSTSSRSWVRRSTTHVSVPSY